MAKARTTPASSGDVELRFNGEPHHKLIVGKVEIAGGKTGSVNAAAAEMLLKASWANVTLADTSAPAWPDNDAEIEELAAKVGVDLPTGSAAGGDVAPSLADKIAALEAAGYTPDSAAAKAAEAGSSNSETEE